MTTEKIIKGMGIALISAILIIGLIGFADIVRKSIVPQKETTTQSSSEEESTKEESAVKEDYSVEAPAAYSEEDSEASSGSSSSETNPSADEARQFVEDFLKKAADGWFPKSNAMENLEIQQLTSADSSWIRDEFMVLDFGKELEKLEDRKNENLILDGFIFYVRYDMINREQGTKDEVKQTMTIIKKNDGSFVMESGHMGYSD